MRVISARGNGRSSGSWMVALEVLKPVRSFLNARTAEGVGKKPMCFLNAANVTRMRSYENAGMPHFSDCVAPGAAAAISARISRSFARTTLGSAAMYWATVEMGTFFFFVVTFASEREDPAGLFECDSEKEECPHFYARPAFESVGVWKYSLSEASCSMRRFNSDMRPSAVLMGMQSWQRVSPQG